MKIHEIVLATDLSSFAITTHRHAGGLARSTGARITLLHVDEASGFPPSYMSEFVLNNVAERRRALLDETARALEEVAEVEVVRPVGEPDQEICAQLERRRPDLLVLGKRGPLGIRRLLLGRTVKRVLRRVRVPTLIVPHSEVERRGFVIHGRILAATDLSPLSVKGLRAALAFAEALNGTLDCLHVLRLPAISFMQPEWPLLSGETELQLRYSLADRMSHVVGSLGSGRCSGSVTIGQRVSATLVQSATETSADLIALAAHGEGGGTRYIGTTPENLIKLSDLPVLVFPVEYLDRTFPD